MKNPKENWIVYILECADSTFYTGITTDIKRRMAEHESGKGAKYTRGRNPLRLVYTEMHTSRSSASKREAQIKKLDKSSKIILSGKQGEPCDQVLY